MFNDSAIPPRDRENLLRYNRKLYAGTSGIEFKMVNKLANRSDQFFRDSETSLHPLNFTPILCTRRNSFKVYRTKNENKSLNIKKI